MEATLSEKQWVSIYICCKSEVFVTEGSGCNLLVLAVDGRGVTTSWLWVCG